MKRSSYFFLFFFPILLLPALSSGENQPSIPTEKISSLLNVSEIFSLHALPEPLVPSGGEPTPSENQALIACLNDFNSRSESDDFSSLENFCSTNSKSPWRLAVLTNLGILQYNAGYFSKCLPTYLAAWQEGKAATETKAKALADRAGGEYAKMLARLGRYTELKSFLNGLKGREFSGQSATLISAGAEGCTTMEKHPEISFRCGPMALSRILAFKKSPLWTSPEILNSKSTMKGMSLFEVMEISKKVGLNYQVAQRTPGSELIFPCVIHWKAGHYAALVKQTGDKYLTEDPTFEDQVTHSLKALEEEASGYFLVPAGKLPAGWIVVSDKEAQTIYGKGVTGGTDGTNSGSDEKKAKEDSDCNKGMANYDFHVALAGLTLSDTPVGYEPPYGLSVNFTLSYAQREASQPSNFNFSNFGTRWNFNWITYLTDDPSSTSAPEQARPGGGKLTFISSAGAVSPGTMSFVNTIKRVRLDRSVANPIPYTITHPDGSKDVYGKPDGSTVSPRRVFLTQKIDSAGNITTLAYDSQMRISSITDAVGQISTFTYGLAGDPYKITKITDPFGRFATFTYDTSGRLTKIKDVVGIESIFTYAGTGNFINSLTTPYGKTTFTSTENGSVRRVTAVDPAGDSEVVELNFLETPAIAFSEPEDSVPEGMTIFNSWLSYRNSFYWNKKQWRETPNDYNKAHLYHWTHSENFSQMSTTTLESEKYPLQSRIWYNYPGQSSSIVEGTQTTPSFIGQKIEGGSRLVSRTIDANGNITQVLDPLGRSTSMVYDDNQVDLKSVTQGTSSILFKATYNLQHRPLTTTEPDGKVTIYTWDAKGQIASVKNAKDEVTTFTYYGANVTGKRRLGRLQSIDGPLSGTADTVTLDYDAYGNVASVIDTDGYKLAFTLDALDRPLRLTYPDGTYEEIAYKALDPLTSRDRLGRITTYVHNSIRQLTSVTDPAGLVTRYRWCKCGELQQLIDAANRVTTWRRDVAGRVTSKEYTNGSKVTYEYEFLSGRLHSIKDEKGQIKIRSYNLDDSLASLVYTNSLRPTANVYFTYGTEFRRIESMTDGIGTTHYTYKNISPGTLGAGQLASIDGPWENDTIEYDYDALGRRNSLSINGDPQSANFDPAGRISSITNGLGVFSYGYDGATSRLISATHAGGVKTLFTYFGGTQDRRLKQIKNLKPGGTTPLSIFDYTYDAGGKIITWKKQQDSATTTAKTFNLGYDKIDQLTSNSVTQGSASISQASWEYGKAGNRIKKTLNGAVSTSSYNALNQLTATSDTLPVVTYEWDSENRLTAVNQGISRSEFVYDGYGRRVKMIEKTNGVITNSNSYLWNGLEESEKRDSSGSSVQQRYFTQGFQQISGSSTENRLYLKDHLGSIREVVDTSGNLLERIDYDAWGKPTFSNTTPISSFAFTGHFWHGDSSLLMAPYRAYDAVKGKWLSRDPIAEEGGINLYNYAGNNPVNYFDPTGLSAMDSFVSLFPNSWVDYTADHGQKWVNAGQGFTEAVDFTGASEYIFNKEGLAQNRCSKYFNYGKITGTVLTFYRNIKNIKVAYRAINAEKILGQVHKGSFGRWYGGRAGSRGSEEIYKLTDDFNHGVSEFMETSIEESIQTLQKNFFDKGQGEHCECPSN